MEWGGAGAAAVWLGSGGGGGRLALARGRRRVGLGWATDRAKMGCADVPSREGEGGGNVLGRRERIDP